MYYFASDMHLGHGDAPSARRREEMLVRWLEQAATDATAIYLLGDVFDFWYEWQEVIPAGHVRLLGKLAELSDRGIEIHLFTGNHDMWQHGYLERECGVRLHYTPEQTLLAGRRVWIGHGDNLNIKGEPMLQLMNSIFRSKVIRALFSWIVHPDCFMRFGKWWSGHSRKSHGAAPSAEVLTPLINYATDYGKTHEVDYFVFGHMHYPSDIESPQRMLFMGDWHNNPSYVSLDNDGKIELNIIKG
jgi:UDP-2,3-diacylglucosamine hydrolase